MKDLKKLWDNEYVRKVKKVHRLIDDHIQKSFYHVVLSFVKFDKILTSIKPKDKTKEKSKEPILTIVK